MLSPQLDLLMKKLDDKSRDKKEVMHIYDSHMTSEECGDIGHSGNHCPEMLEDVNYINNNNNNNYYNCPQQNQDVDESQSAVYLRVYPRQQFVGRRCAKYELDGDARHRQAFYPGSAAELA